MADQEEAPALRNGASSNGHFSIISGIVYHPDWESVLYRADIALMKMKVPIPILEHSCLAFVMFTVFSPLILNNIIVLYLNGGDITHVGLG